jgi:hypothetical protein
MRGSKERTAGPEALVIGEVEPGGALVGGGSSSGDPATFLVRELSDGGCVQLRADEKQLGASAVVLLLDAVAVKAGSDAFIWDSEDARVHGWHAPRDRESRCAAGRQ